MDMYDYITGGGIYRTESGYDVNVSTILVKSGNTYPLSGNVRLARNYYANVSWTANGTVINYSSTNYGMNLVPLISISSYVNGNTLTLSGYANVSSWQTQYNVIQSSRPINY